MLTPIETESLLTSGSVVIPFDRDLIVASGEDAASFLNGQLSQAILPISIGQSRWSLLLDPKGKVVSWLRVSHAKQDEYWLESDVGTGDVVITRLNRFKLRTKVEFELVVARCFAVRGSEIPERPESTATQMSVNIGWQGAKGFDIIGPDVDQPEGPLGSTGMLEALRILDGVPRMGHEFLGSTIPAETGVIAISADFAKGCYTGQELVTRVNSRGSNTPRKIHRLSFDADPSLLTTAVPTVATPAEPQDEVRHEVLLGGEPAGFITSWAVFGGSVVALASIKRSADTESLATVATNDGVVDATIEPHHVLESDGR